MSKSSVYVKGREAWEYMQQRGRVYFFVKQPIFFVLTIILVIFSISFISRAYQVGFQSTVGDYIDTLQKDAQFFITAVIAGFLFTSSCNILYWYHYKRKYDKV